MQRSSLARFAVAAAIAASAQAAGASGASAPLTPTVAMAPAQEQVVSPGVQATEAPLSDFNPAGLPFRAGTYECELNRRVQVRTVSADLQFATLNWDRKDYTLRAVSTKTGALRYEDNASGLVWLVIVGKSMLLDTKNGKQLANECKT
ncbi:MliC family protein [Quisquiliibacterium transsilvanicum]|jgi:hypothetical protein|uniref:C-type lysozyme inhibitor domain-containing protein n=1 Tax=Quisquiliibacterium transsilvanicum TaxID=1549638 RepID=A0A7W8HKC6_9BURK|nr:MliC family protein [Quisquiliibacterium transsilvanicum]MBB5273662.1 hypothetical protein [Quisquiliibacterium transsilvanicum]